MKKYMMIFTGTPYEKLGLSPEVLQNKMGQWFAWGNKMGEAGILHGGEALKPEATRIEGPGRTRTDGPFAESKELVGGFYIVEAESVEAVIKIAEDYPDYDLDGGVEIREIQVFEQ